MKKEKTITTNFALNFIRTILTLVFPVITFSYASRVLGKEGIGKVNFATSVVSYYTMIASLGIANYGIREGARIRDQKEKFSKLVQELFVINLIMTSFSYVVFFIMICFVPQMQNYKSVLLIYGLSIGLAALGLEWVYSAQEDYYYITIRQIVIQGISIVLLLVLVRDTTDYLYYALILVVSSVGANVFNFAYSRKYVDWKYQGHYDLKRHLKPVLILFSYTVSVNLYNNLDSTMLGLQIGDTEVGIYSAAVKMNRMVISLLASLGVVLIPRISYYLEKREQKKFEVLVKKSMQFNLMFSIPAAVGMFVLGEEIITLFSGSGFSEATTTLRILTLIIMIIPITTLVNSQILIPSKKETYVALTTLVGLIVNFCLNYIFIPIYGANGAAAASVLAEFSVMCVALVFVRKVLDIRQAFKGAWQYIVASLPIFFVSGLVHYFVSNIFLIIILCVGLSCGVYIIMLLILKNDFVKEIIQKGKKILHR